MQFEYSTEIYNDTFFLIAAISFLIKKECNSLPDFINCILQIQLLKPNSLFWLQQIHILRRILYQGWAGAEGSLYMKFHFGLNTKYIRIFLYIQNNYGVKTC